MGQSRPVENSPSVSPRSESNTCSDCVTCFSVCRRHDMAVDIKSDGDAGMPEHLLNGLGVDACHEAKTGSAVSKVVEGNSGKVVLLDDPVVVRAPKVCLAEKSPIGSGEDSSIVLPSRTELQTLLILNDLALSKHRCHRIGELNRTA